MNKCRHPFIYERLLQAALEAGNLKSRCWQGRFLPRVVREGAVPGLSLACRWPSACSHGVLSLNASSRQEPDLSASRKFWRLGVPSRSPTVLVSGEHLLACREPPSHCVLTWWRVKSKFFSTFRAVLELVQPCVTLFTHKP